MCGSKYQDVINKANDNRRRMTANVDFSACLRGTLRPYARFSVTASMDSGINRHVLWHLAALVISEASKLLGMSARQVTATASSDDQLPLAELLAKLLRGTVLLALEHAVEIG